MTEYIAKEAALDVINFTENKYHGVNDMPHGWTNNSLNKRIYRLWFDIHRRCYDESQHGRKKGASYKNCEVCDRWHFLSNFAQDIKQLSGFDEWANGKGMSIDKDILSSGRRIYSPSTCCFVSISENIREKNSRCPTIKFANEAHKVHYALSKDGKTIIFDSEKAACEYLGVRQCTVSSCYLKGRTCKGYEIARMDGEENG